MKTLTLFCLILSTSSVILGQTTIIDSLKSELNSSIQDSHRVNILNDLSKKLLHSNLDEALSYANSAEDLSIKIGYVGGRIDALLHRSSIVECSFSNSENPWRIRR